MNKLIDRKTKASKVASLIFVIVASLLLLLSPLTFSKAQAADGSERERLKRSNDCSTADANHFVDKHAKELLTEILKKQAEQKTQKNETNSSQERKRQKKYKSIYMAILKEAFAFETVARSLVGPYWRKMSSQQRNTYTNLISYILQTTIGNNIYSLQVENYSIEEASRLGKDFAVRLLVKLENEAEMVPVVWRVRCFQTNSDSNEAQQETKNMGIVDLLFRNVSVIAGKRAEMTSLLSKRGVAEFIALLTMERDRLRGSR